MKQLPLQLQLLGRASADRCSIVLEKHNSQSSGGVFEAPFGVTAFLSEHRCLQTRCRFSLASGIL